MQVARDIESSREVRLPSGHRVALYGRSPEDDLKFAAALHGQGGGAITIAEAMLRFAERDQVALLTVHDELVMEVPETMTDDACRDYMLPMVQLSDYMRGFSCPAKVVVGPNWRETRDLGTIRL